MIRPLFPVLGPFVKSKGKFGYSGVVEYDDTEDKIRCHECGKYYEYLGPHLRRIHKTTAAAHKMKFGLNLNMPLCGKRLSEVRSKQMLEWIQKNGRRKAIRANEKRKYKSSPKRQSGTQTEAFKNKYGLCDLQMKTRYEVIKIGLGRMPTTQEIRARDHALLSAIERRFGTLNKFRESVGDRAMTAQEHQMKSEAELIELLIKKRDELKRIPTYNDFKKADGIYPQATVYYGRFGSWNHALSLAGIK